MDEFSLNFEELDYEFDKPNSEDEYFEEVESEFNEITVGTGAIKNIKLNRTFAKCKHITKRRIKWNTKLRCGGRLFHTRIRALDNIFMPQHEIDNKIWGPVLVKSIKHTRPLDVSHISVVIENVGCSFRISKPRSSLNDCLNILTDVCVNYKYGLTCPEIKCDFLHELPANFTELLDQLSENDFKKFYNYIKNTRIFSTALPYLVSHLKQLNNTESLFKIIPDVVRCDTPKLLSLIIFELIKKGLTPEYITAYLVRHYYADVLLLKLLEIFTFVHHNLPYFWNAIILIFQSKSVPFPSYLIEDLITKASLSKFSEKFKKDIQCEVIDKCLVSRQ